MSEERAGLDARDARIAEPGDIRYCWNPYRHWAHDYAYPLPEGGDGSYWCRGSGFGQTPEQAVAAYLREHTEPLQEWAQEAVAAYKTGLAEAVRALHDNLKCVHRLSTNLRCRVGPEHEIHHGGWWLAKDNHDYEPNDVLSRRAVLALLEPKP